MIDSSFLLSLVTAVQGPNDASVHFVFEETMTGDATCTWSSPQSAICTTITSPGESQVSTGPLPTFAVARETVPTFDLPGTPLDGKTETTFDLPGTPLPTPPVEGSRPAGGNGSGQSTASTPEDEDGSGVRAGVTVYMVAAALGTFLVLSFF